VTPAVNAAAGSLAGAITPLFVISVGTALEEGEEEHTRRRIYEFSPPGWDRKDTFGQLVESVCRTLKSDDGRCTGGAGKFLTAIATEMIPTLAATVPIDTAQLSLFGPFKNYLISSPAMAYGRGEIFRQEANYAASHQDLPVGIYLAAGTLEASDPQFEGIGEIVSGMSRLAGVLATRKYPGLKVTIEYHPGMGHSDVMTTSVVRGLRTPYGT
jgi:predicted alpha/beta superfamily hydrolase